MNVLIGIPCLLTGGTEIQTLSLVQALIAAGHNVTVACYFEYDDAMAERYRHTGARVRLLSPYGKRPSGIRKTALHLWKGLRAAVKATKPDIVHVQYMAPGALTILILKALGVKKIIATAHTAGDIYSPNGIKLIRFLTDHCLSGFQCITQLAEKSYFDDSKLFDGTPSKHFTIYNNIPSHICLLSEHRKAKASAEPITVGVVSRLEHIKGMDLVVPAFAKAASQDSRLRLLVVGDGTERVLMERKSKEMGIEGKVEFAGRQPQDKLQAYYDAIDVLLMPSRSEGFGLTAVEGMARGCVPVVSDTGGLPEVLGDSECGYLHRPEDVDDMAAKILAASADLNRMSTAAIRRAADFSYEKYRQQIAELYSQLDSAKICRL